jgi:hypothetical protein
VTTQSIHDIVERYKQDRDFLRERHRAGKVRVSQREFLDVGLTHSALLRTTMPFLLWPLEDLAALAELCMIASQRTDTKDGHND